MRKYVAAARKREDIIRERDEYNADRAARLQDYEKEQGEWRQALNSIEDTLKTSVEHELTSINLPLEIEAHAYSDFRSRELSVSVSCFSSGKDVHREDKALSWSWKVLLTIEGQIKKESNSWSGLQAVTSQQIDTLRESVNALEILNNMDWPSLLDISVPEATDYVKTDVPRDRSREFNRELDEAELEEAIQDHSFIEGAPNSGKFYGKSYYCVLKESPAQYTIAEAPATAVEKFMKNGNLSINNRQIHSFAELYDYYMENKYHVFKRKFVDMIKHPINALGD